MAQRERTVGSEAVRVPERQATSGPQDTEKPISPGSGPCPTDGGTKKLPAEEGGCM